MEVWKWIDGYENRYEVSNLGRVRSWCIANSKKSRAEPLILKSQNVNAYKAVNLGKNNQQYIHILVAEAFIGKRPGAGSEIHCCHRDGDTSNNSASNLRWDTVAANHADKVAHGTNMEGEKHHAAKLTQSQVIEIREKLKTAKRGDQDRIAIEYGVGQTTISKIKRGVIWREEE